DSRVAPQGGDVGRFEIRTPLMVTGVRGTRYRVSADDAGSRSEVIEGRVGVGAGVRPGPATPVEAGFGIGVSPAGKLSKPAALLPAPDIAALPQPVMGHSVTVHWSPVPGAVGYRVEVARDPALTEWVSSGEVTAPEAVLSDLPDGPLQLAVSALSQDRLTGVAAVQPFTVRRNPPAPFSLAPEPDATVHGGAVAFRWAAVQGVSGYELALAADSAFAQQADMRREDGVEASRTLPVGRWWWRLRSLDAQNRPGPWSDALQVTVQPAPPTPAPVDDGSVLRVHWPADAAGGAAAGYVLQMAADPGFETGLVTLPTTESMVSIPRPAEGTYFIRVARARGDAMPPVQAFSPPQRLDIRAVLRDGLGGVVVFGAADKGVQIGTQ
ncbi:MAG: FecR domain-containing protein, partial [Dyella sp.]|nr:FecR domain-containing protein [Dyella sp.]